MLIWIWTLVALAADPTLQPQVTEVPQEDGSVRIVPDRQVPRDASGAQRVLLELGETDLYDLTAFFADVMRKNFLVADERALRSKTVRLIGHESMTVDAAWQAFKSALHAHGFTSIEEGEVITIVNANGAVRSPLDIGRGAPPAGVGFTTRLLPLDSARATDIVQVIRPLMSSEAQLIAYAPANTLIVTDIASNVRKAAELVAQLDIAAPDSAVRFTVLKYAEASAVRVVIESLYPSRTDTPKPAASSSRRTRSRSKSSATPATQTTSTGAESEQVSRVLHDERTNALIVLANPEGHAAVAELVAQLDTDIDGTERSELHVVRLAYALAEEVSAVLQQLQSEGQQRRAPEGEARADLAAALDGEARIAADPVTNSLVVVADPAQFAAIEDLIGELDVARGQVFVDAVFVELSSSGAREVGTSTHVLPSDGHPLLGSLSLDPGGDLSSLAVSPELLSGLAAGVFGPTVDVVTSTGTLAVPLFGIVIRALQVSSDVQVMDNPGLLTLDHDEATMSIGRRIPYQSSTSLAVSGLPVNTFDRVDVNLELTFTPHINDEQLVTLDVALTIDEVEGESTEAGLQGGPVTSGRTVNSRVMVQDGQTIALATMANTKVDKSRSKVPILGDIPLLGLLFRGSRRETRRTHLMVFLTPHIVAHPRDLLAIRHRKEAQRQEFVRRFQGKDGVAWLDELQGLLQAGG